MPVDIPSPDQIISAFEASLTLNGPSNQTEVMDEFRRLLRTTLDPSWRDRGSGVTVLEIGGKPRLIRVTCAITIDNHDDGQRRRILNTFQRLGTLITAAIAPGTQVDFRFEHESTKEVPLGKLVGLFASGVIRDSAQ